LNAKSEAVLPPLPLPDEQSRGYWEAAREGRLAIQRCGACRRWYHPPGVICTACGSEKLAFENVSGRGTVYGYSVMHDKRVRGFEHRVPYISVWVELAEQPLLITVGNLVGVSPSEVRIGLPVEVFFEKLNDEVTLPQFRRAGGPR
jgi:uncharacterized OB-fold protein